MKVCDRCGLVCPEDDTFAPFRTNRCTALIRRERTDDFTVCGGQFVETVDG